MADILKFSDATFTGDISNDQVTLVDFWAPWCGPCRAIAPVLEELAKEYDTKVRIGKLNVDENPKTASQFSVQSIPTMLVFKGGEVVDQIVGLVPKDKLATLLDTHL